MSYESTSVKRKINDLDFTSIETSVTKNEIINRLISNGYKFINAEFLSFAELDNLDLRKNVATPASEAASIKIGL